MNVNVLVCWTEPTRLEMPSEKERNYQSASSDTAWYEKGSDYFYKVIIGWTAEMKKNKDILQTCIRFMANHQPYLEYQTYQSDTTNTIYVRVI